MFSAKSCPDLEVSNGIILSSATNYIYGHNISVICELGYQMQGENSLLCQANGTWDKETPTCIGKYCIVGSSSNCSQSIDNSRHLIGVYLEKI